MIYNIIHRALNLVFLGWFFILSQLNTSERFTSKSQYVKASFVEIANTKTCTPTLRLKLDQRTLSYLWLSAPREAASSAVSIGQGRCLKCNSCWLIYSKLAMWGLCMLSVYLSLQCISLEIIKPENCRGHLRHRHSDQARARIECHKIGLIQPWQRARNLKNKNYIE